MTGKIINQYNNMVTIQIDEAYEFNPDEKVELKITKKTYLDEIRSLYWVLLNFVVDYSIHLDLSDKWFNAKDPKQLALKKLYTFLRFQVGFIDTIFNADGMPEIVAKSTNNKNITQKEFSKLYEDTFEYLIKYMQTSEIDNFNRQYQKAREKLGKD